MKFGVKNSSRADTTFLSSRMGYSYKNSTVRGTERLKPHVSVKLDSKWEIRLQNRQNLFSVVSLSTTVKRKPVARQHPIKLDLPFLLSILALLSYYYPNIRGSVHRSWDCFLN